MTLYHLARNSNQQEKLASEIRDVLPAQGNAITPECLQNLRYLRVCVKESMRFVSKLNIFESLRVKLKFSIFHAMGFRLSPITDGNARITDKDMVVAGYNIPAGVKITHIGDSFQIHSFSINVIARM